MSVASAEEADAEVADSVHEGVGVQVAAVPITGEEPRAGGSCRGAQVRTVGAVFLEQCGERCRDRDRVGAEDQTQLVCDDEVVGGLQRGDLDQWLAVEQQQCSGDTVWQGFGGAGEQFAYPVRVLVFRSRGD